MRIPSPFPAALILATAATAAIAQDQSAYLRALDRCDADYVKRTTACRRAVGNYRCLQTVLDRLSACRQGAERLQPKAPAATLPDRAGTAAPAR